MSFLLELINLCSENYKPYKDSLLSATILKHKICRSDSVNSVTTRIPTEDFEGMRLVITKYPYKNEDYVAVIKKYQTNLQITNWRCKNKTSRTIATSGKCFNRGLNVRH